MNQRLNSITARIDRITQLTSEYRSPTPPVPKSVKIELTARCDCALTGLIVACKG